MTSPTYGRIVNGDDTLPITEWSIACPSENTVWNAALTVLSGASTLKPGDNVKFDATMRPDQLVGYFGVDAEVTGVPVGDAGVVSVRGSDDLRSKWRIK